MSNPRHQTLTNGHRYALKRLSSYMDGQLTDREHARVQAHLKTCPDCREELRALRWTQSLAQQMPVMPVPRSFIVRQADLEARHIAQPRPLLVPALARLQTAAAIVAVLLVVAITGDVFVGRRLLGGQSARTFSAESSGPAPATLAIAQAHEEMEATPPGEQTDPVPAAPEMMQMVVPTDTLTIAQVEIEAAKVLTDAGTLAEPSLTLPPRPTRASTKVGHPADSTSTQTTPTLTATATVEPTHTLIPTETAVPTPTAGPTLTAHTSPPEPTQVSQIQDTPAPTNVWREDLGSGGEPVPQPERRGEWPGWRITQIGLGVVLVGLLIAILWLRRWGRLG